MEFQPIATIIAPIGGTLAGAALSYLASKKYFTRRLAGTAIVKRYERSSAYLDDLTDHVLEHTGEGQPIRISVGISDTCVAWLKRIYNESNKTPKISEIRIKRISPELAKLLINEGLLEKNFLTTLETNLDSLRNDKNIRRERTNVVVTEWMGLPSFQGYLFNEQGFTSHWQVNGEGQLDARTPLERYTKSTAPDRFSREVGAFDLG